MAERRTLDIAAPRGGIASGSAKRDPANELYDQACSLLEAAQGLRAAADSWRSAPALAASLGCIEASLQELRDAVPALCLRVTCRTAGRAARLSVGWSGLRWRSGGPELTVRAPALKPQHVVGLPTLTEHRA
jgi:hypothetical protein